MTELAKTKKEMFRFFIVGCAAVGTDTLSYFIMVEFLFPSIAKAISFSAGSVVAYFLGKYWTFEQQKKSVSEVIRFIVLYLSTLGVNVLVNDWVLMAMPGAKEIAFLCATATSTVLNFIGQKWWVFKRK